MSTHDMDRESPPEPEVVAVGRRRFSAGYKLRILEEADGCTEPGEVGALLRREGLYSSNLVRWRRARARGELGGDGGQVGSRETSGGQRKEVEQLRREKARLEARLAQAEAIIEAQKKLSELLGLMPAERDERR